MTNMQLKIEVDGYGKTSASDQSDNFFTVLAPTPTPTPIPPSPTPTPQPLQLTITSPNGGEVLNPGDTYRITWTTSPTIDQVSISLNPSDSQADWIAFTASNSGYYDWTVSRLGWTNYSQFKIEMTGYQTGYGSVTDTSDNYFTILGPTPTPTPTPMPIYTSPNGVRRIGGPSTNTGNGVGVAVIDTGIDLSHPALAPNIVANTTCVAGTTSGNDDNGHGSHVAGTIAAKQTSNSVVGVAPDAKLVAVKVLDAYGNGYWSDLICGVDWVTANAATYNIKAANLSLGGSGTSDNNCGLTNNDPVHQAICNSTAAGVTYAVAAGNSNRDTSSFIPAAYDDTEITVSALADSDGKPGGLYIPTSYGPDDTFATFSNYGSAVDLGAPGVDIYSTYKNGQFATLSGTSMATPHVTGAMALYFYNHPGATWTEVKNALVAAGETLGNGHTDPSGNHPEPVLQIGSL